MDGSRLRKLRLEADLSMRQLAEDTGISMKSLDRYEREDASPSAEYVIILADYFNVSADWLLGLTDDMRSYNNSDLSSVENRLLKAYRAGDTNTLLLLLADLVRAHA